MADLFVVRKCLYAQVYGQQGKKSTKGENTLVFFAKDQVCISIHIHVSSLIWIIGPSGVRALPSAAGINVGGHYFR